MHEYTFILNKAVARYIDWYACELSYIVFSILNKRLWLSLSNLILQQLKQFILWLFYEIRWAIENHKPL